MIFPYLRGFLSPRSAPATWFLLLLNLVVYFGTATAYERAQSIIDGAIDRAGFVSTQGELFAQLIEHEPHLFSESLASMQRRVQIGDEQARDLLGAIALRNPQFVSHALAYRFEGDQIAIDSWRADFSKILAAQDEHPSFQWGLSHQNARARNWITYQVAHGGFMHLLLNMIFFLIFASYLETRIGSSLVIIGYLASGLAGAWAFTKLTGLTSSPLIGASASVSGLGALVAFHAWREKLPFFYLILPQPGYMGVAAFPAWLILILFSLPDLAGYVSSMSDVSSVAYSAHLGGALMGGVMALGLRFGALVEDPYDPASSTEYHGRGT